MADIPQDIVWKIDDLAQAKARELEFTFPISQSIIVKIYEEAAAEGYGFSKKIILEKEEKITELREQIRQMENEIAVLENELDNIE